jgi:putative protease
VGSCGSPHPRPARENGGERLEEAAVSEQPVGVVTHFFPRPSVAGISILEGHLSVGDTIYISGHTTGFSQTIESMQIDHEPVEVANVGDQVGIKVIDRVRVKDKVFRVSAQEQTD